MRLLSSLVAALLLALSLGVASSRASLVVETATREVRRGEEELKEGSRKRERERERYEISPQIVDRAFEQSNAFSPLFSSARAPSASSSYLHNCNAHARSL